MRHPKGKSRQAAILLNNPAEDPGKDKPRPGVCRPNCSLEFGQSNSLFDNIGMGI